MAMLEINKNPSARELNWFGLLLIIFAAGVGSWLYFRGSPFAGQLVWGVGGGLAAVFFAVPPARRYIYLGWLYAAYPIGYVVSHVIMGVIYFGVVTPVGLIMRALGHDPMTRSFDKQAKTYWIEHRTDRDPKRYFKQF
jgi:ABC-type uncharacterized transport system permease subunit